MLYPFAALSTHFPDLAFAIKGDANDGIKPPSCPSPDIAFINEEATSCINEEAASSIIESDIGVIIAPRNPTSCFLISCFTVSVAHDCNNHIFI